MKKESLLVEMSFLRMDQTLQKKDYENSCDYNLKNVICYLNFIYFSIYLYDFFLRNICPKKNESCLSKAIIEDEELFQEVSNEENEKDFTESNQNSRHKIQKDVNPKAR